MKSRYLITLIMLVAVSVLISCGGQQTSEKAEPAPENLVRMVFLTTLHCDGCVNTIQTRMPDNEGIAEAQADLETKLVRVSYDPSLITEEGIVEAFGELGYEASTSAAEFPSGSGQQVPDTLDAGSR